MQLVSDRFPGVLLLLRLNADRVISLCAVVLCLLAGAFLASVMVAG